MQDNKSQYKIYSRRRLSIFNKRKSLGTRKAKKCEKFFPVFVVFMIAILVCYFLWESIKPVFMKLCEDKTIIIANKITNEESSNVIEKYGYNDLFKIERNKNGDVQLISANVFMIDKITSEIAWNIQEKLEEYDDAKVKFPIGVLSGNNFFVGFGPDIKIKFKTTGIVMANLKSDFISQGNNQTLHKVYLQVDCSVSVITTHDIESINVQNEVLLLENVIVGDIGLNGLPLLQKDN